jgi:dTDP-4-amino-4,6-dideoxygalactose transaminase
MIKYEDLKKVNKLLVPNYKSLFNSFWNEGSYILGERLARFENNFSKFIGVKYAVGVNSGYDALYLSLKCLELPKNSEVILSSCSYIAAINAVIANGLKPILVEPNINTYNIDVNKIEKSITKKTKVILITHLYGRSCEMSKIMSIKKKNKLFLVEDCAQSHGSKILNKTTGSFGDFGCFSFYPTKNLGGLGDGGLITAKKKKYFDKLKQLRNYGFKKKDISNLLGVNSRLDDFQAMFLNKKLEKLNKINNHKIKLAKLYDQLLSDKFIKPKKSFNFNNIYHIYPIRYKNRDKLISFLAKNNIQASCHYPTPPHLQSPLKKFFVKKYPISEKIHKTVLSLPISYSHSEKDVKHICKIINK